MTWHSNILRKRKSVQTCPILKKTTVMLHNKATVVGHFHNTTWNGSKQYWVLKRQIWISPQLKQCVVLRIIDTEMFICQKKKTSVLNDRPFAYENKRVVFQLLGHLYFTKLLHFNTLTFNPPINRLTVMHAKTNHKVSHVTSCIF